MALLIQDAQLLTNNDLELGVVEEIVDKEELFAVLPFMGIDGKAYVYNRETVPSEADFLAPNSVVAEGTMSFTEVVTTLRILIGDVDVDKFLQGSMSNTNNQKAIQIASKAKGLARKFRRNLAQGDTSLGGVHVNEFDGIAKIANDITYGTGGVTGANGITNAGVAFATADPTRTIYADLTATQAVIPTTGTAGAALTLKALDALLDAVPNGADALFMNRQLIRTFRGLIRSTGQGGISGSELMLPAFGSPMLCHNGIPILANDFIPVNETHGTSVGTTSSIYAIRLNEVDGLHGLYGGGTAGVVVEDIGTVQNKDATRTRLKWYCGLALKSTLSLARLKGVNS